MSVSVENSELARRQSPKVLIISGRPDSSPLFEAISQAGFAFSTTASCSEAILSLQQEAPAAAILDLTHSGMEGLEVLRSVKTENIPTAMIAVSRVGSLRLAIEAIKLGAFDYLVEPFDSEQLLSTIRKATIHETGEAEAPQRQVSHYAVFHKQSAASPIMREICDALDKADKENGAVCIAGENEIGKDVCAHGIHFSSIRQNQPFVAVYCAAMPPEMIESEIFGHIQGALPTAFMDRTGAVTEADGGTLLLNDVSALSLELQAKLARLIGQGTFQRIGSEKLEQADLRIICSGARDPQEELQNGTLHKELFNQIQSAIVYLPPLHQCSGDIALLAKNIHEEISADEGPLRKAEQETDIDSGEQRLSGDVRGLQSALYNAITLNGGELPSETAQQNAMPKEIEGTELDSESGVVFVETSAKTVRSIKPLWLVEKEAITEALEICGQNVPKAAAYLEVGVSTIYRKKAEWEAEERSKAS